MNILNKEFKIESIKIGAGFYNIISTDNDLIYTVMRSNKMWALLDHKMCVVEYFKTKKDAVNTANLMLEAQIMELKELQKIKELENNPVVEEYNEIKETIESYKINSNFLVRIELINNEFIIVSIFDNKDCLFFKITNRENNWKERLFNQINFIKLY